MATCRTRNPNATAPRRVPGASAGGERGSSAPPPIRRRGKEVEEKCPHQHWRPLRASDGFGHLKGLGFLFRRATRLLSGA